LKTIPRSLKKAMQVVKAPPSPLKTTPIWTDSDDHEDEDRGDWEEVGDDTEIVLEVEQLGHKNTFSLHMMNTHTYTLTIYKGDADQFFYDHQNKKLTTQKLYETVKLLIKWNFKTADRVWWIWQNSVNTLSNMNMKFKVYTKQNSKRIVRINSPYRGASFLCRTHV
jgi:hypothetical protein